MIEYLPEGENMKEKPPYTERELTGALQKRQILEGRALKCDSEHNLLIEFGAYIGLMPKNECALGIKDNTVREIAIITRVNKTVAFRIVDIKKEGGLITPILSRAALQEECLNYLLENTARGDIIPAKVTHLEPFGAFVDIGCGVTSLISIDNISVSRISHPKDRFKMGQKIYAAVKEKDILQKRLILTHKELLGTWEENASLFKAGQTVRGVIRSIESYGAFVELAPNLAGLAQCLPNMEQGQTAAVYIKSIQPEKMKVKLNIITLGEREKEPMPLSYFYKEGHIDLWEYSPEGCSKVIYTKF